MAKVNLPPLPWGALDFNSQEWQQWFSSLRDYLQSSGIPWADINFDGSSLSDIQSRAHNQLTGVQGGGQFHLSSDQLALLNSITKANYTPTVTNISFTSVTGYYSRVDTTVNFTVEILGTSMVPTSTITITLPFTASRNAAVSVHGETTGGRVVWLDAGVDVVKIPTFATPEDRLTISGTYFVG